MPMDYTALGSGCVTLLLNVGLLALALVLVRKANATAGYALAAGAGFRVLATCCVDFGVFGIGQSGNYELLRALTTVFRLVALIDAGVFWGAVAFAAVTMARAISTASNGGGAHE